MAYLQVSALARAGEPETRTVFYFSVSGIGAGAFGGGNDGVYIQIGPVASQRHGLAGFTKAYCDELAEHNIQVIACREGQAVGQESNVRVFDIQHIKGLEFEAVFFVGIDQLAALHPALFDKYLYVGTTRAATYLGVTCEGALPPAIESLRTHFGQDWQAPGSQQAVTEQ